MVTSLPEAGSSNSWLLLHYRIPPEPTSGRVYVWRKLKTLGALLLHDSVWVLPAGDRPRESLRWLSVEIEERGGEALVWEAQLSPPDRAADLVQQFQSQAEAGYAEVIAALGRPNPDLAALSRRYQHIRNQDFFNSPSGERARAALLAAQEGNSE